MPAQFATAPDGTRIAFAVTGDGPALMLLHGRTMERAAWARYGYIEALAPYFSVIAVDVRGYGDSDGPANPAAYGAANLTADFLAVADAAGFERFSVLGYSYGGRLAFTLATRTHRLERMVAGGAGMAAPDEAALQTKIGHLEAIARARAEGRLDQFTIPIPGSAAYFARANLPALIASHQGDFGWPGVQPQDLRCPSLIYVGTEDEGPFNELQALSPALIAADIPLIIHEGMTHGQAFVERDRVLEPAIAFLRGGRT